MIAGAFVFLLTAGVIANAAAAETAPLTDGSYVRAGFALDPHTFQVKQKREALRTPSPEVRRRAAEALGFLRALDAAADLAAALKDEKAEVRREAALSLAWCGGRAALSALLGALSDADWSVRQSAWVALCNLTGMAFPFDALAKDDVRAGQVAAWRAFLDSIPADGAPREVLALLGKAQEPAKDLAAGCKVTASSTYKGPPGVLTDDEATLFWQTKNVEFPQHCTVDLGGKHEIGYVAVEQYGPGYCMTDCAIQTSIDGTEFQTAWEQKTRTEPRLTVSFERRRARYVRIVSRASEKPLYPTTFYRVRIYERAPGSSERVAPETAAVERGLRALGVFGGTDASNRIVSWLETARNGKPDGDRTRLLVLAGLRSLGRLGLLDRLGKAEVMRHFIEAARSKKPDAERIPPLILTGLHMLMLESLGDTAEAKERTKLLTKLLDEPYWARYAADALGDCSSDELVPAIAEAYPKYAREPKDKGKEKDPKSVPPDDRPGFESIDRAYETPFALASALARMPLNSPEALASLRRIAPLLLANLPGDFDGAMLYEPEAHQLIVAYLLERAGVRAAFRDLALMALKESPVDASSVNTLTADEQNVMLPMASGGAGGTSVAASWLPVLCRPGECVEALVRLLEHPNGWVRINAAKTLLFTGERSAAVKIAKLLDESKPEAEYGYNGAFLFKTGAKQGQDEYNAPSPCWREAFTRALGELGGPENVPLLQRLLLKDEGNVLEVQYAAAASLDRIGSNEALKALKAAAFMHPFHSVRLLAQEGLWRRGLEWLGSTPSTASTPTVTPSVNTPTPENGRPPAVVFIKGDNNMPNDFQIDIWRQTYSTTDSGPTYRLGRNLYLLRPVAPDGKVTALTEFEDGYVADCEVSWDGRRVLFAHRGGERDPWWHLYEIEADGRGLRQLTKGPYHDVQPAYLPDGRIVFSSSRIGLRDEYHGYPATGLTVMNADASDIHCIGFNLGRDNEPTILPDGRIAFSRLDLFYSRLKTEMTVQAVFPDGSKDVTLYGPERREMWREVTAKSKERWWGEVPPRHRVLRMTQPQPFDAERILCASTGGPVLVGPGRLSETFIPLKEDMAVTGLFPLGGEQILCAATRRTFKKAEVDLGLYLLNARTGELKLVYNDPLTAEFEPRPLMARTVPPVLSESARSESFTGRLLCSSARTSQEALTRERGKLLRIVEGQPIPSRHHTHTNSAGEAWKNHVGTNARVLGTVPLAADGSFFVEVPADRLIHCQVLDTDRNVVGNQLIWMYARPGETKSCIGCHEIPDTSPPLAQGFAASARVEPLRCLPTGGEFTYRAKVWQKGSLRPETEERTRTVQAINLLGR